MSDSSQPITKDDLQRSLQAFGKQLVVGIIGQLRRDMRTHHEQLLEALHGLEQHPQERPADVSLESEDMMELKSHIEEMLNAHTEEMLQAIADMVEPLQDQLANSQKI